MKIKVLDGRNVHELPDLRKLKIRKIDIVSRYVSPQTETEIICLMLDGMLTPCVRLPNAPREEYEFILCPAYKTKRGFLGWLYPIYPDAEEI